MSLSNPFARRLYLRIWLAVVGGIAVLTLVVGWAWRIAEEQKASNNQPFVPPSREMVLRDAKGDVVFQGPATRQPSEPGENVEFHIESDTGQAFVLQMAPRQPRIGGRPGSGPNQGDAAFWTRPPFGFLWLLGIVGLAVAAGVYPIIRRLTLRLEALQRSVKHFGEGDLSVRVPEQGQDEVADLARQFNAAAERVETLVKSHKSLLANASHELRSPLTRIRMGIELMGSTPSPTFKNEIARNIGELDELIEEILLASRLAAREADLGTVEEVDLTGLVAEECARLGATFEGSQQGDPDSLPAALRAADGSDADGPSVAVRGVTKLLRRAVRNLLENARRYTSGPVTVTLQQLGERAVLHVFDRGPGVPPDQRARIFEPFYRLPGASERDGGVGLGLALVKSIAERHGGSVHCEGREGGGACFVIELPSVA